MGKLASDPMWGLGCVERCIRSVHRVPTAALVVVALVAVGCSSADALGATQRAEAQTLVIERASIAMIDLSDEDRDCVVDEITPLDLDRLRNGEVGEVADAVVSCLGDDLIGASVLGSQVGEISEASLDCAVSELDRRFLVDLVAGAMNGTQPQVQSEIEVARVLSVCLELEELL